MGRQYAGVMRVQEASRLLKISRQGRVPCTSGILFCSSKQDADTFFMAGTRLFAALSDVWGFVRLFPAFGSWLPPAATERPFMVVKALTPCDAQGSFTP